jgi:predicted transcriptional regulator
LEKYFPTAAYHQSSDAIDLLGWEAEMARLRDGERSMYEEQILRTIRRHYQGVREQELAQMVLMDRRRLNNYLRDLQKSGRIVRDGRLWFSR